MPRHPHKTVWLISISMVLGALNAYSSSPGLASNGVSTLYNLTWLCLNLSFWALVLSICIFNGRAGLIISAAASTVFIYWSLKLDIDQYRLRSINVGLVNTLGQYHPPMLYVHHSYLLYRVIIGTGNKILPHRRTIRKGSDLVWLIVASVLLSSWWANQELFWGNWWNWDPVEMVSLGFILLSAYHNHQTVLGFLLKNRGSTTYIVLTHCTLMYLVVRGPLANSVHSFTNSYWMRLDRELFYHVLIALVVVGFLTWWMAIRLRVTGRPTKRFVSATAIAYVPTAVLLFMYVGPALTPSVYINLLVAVGISTLLSANPRRLGVSIDTTHLAILILPLTALVVWEPLVHLLIIDNSTNRQFGAGLQQLNVWCSQPDMAYKTSLYANPTRSETKHFGSLTICGGGVSKKAYLRPSSGIEFYTLLPQTQIVQTAAATSLLYFRKRIKLVLW
jgi:hypothetical protein